MATQASVAATLRKKKVAMTITRSTPGSYDPVYGFDGSAVATYTVFGLLGSFNTLDRVQAANSTGSVVQVGDKKVTIEAGVVVPVPGDKITINGVDWTVITVDAVNPLAVDLMYKLQVRR